jgi:DNA adenine methylase
LANFMKWVVRSNGLLDGEYVEVYGGGAGIAWSLLFEEYVSKVHINDVDPFVMAFWWTVLDEPDALCALVSSAVVTIDEWRRHQAVLARPAEHSRTEIAFSTFFLNRTNRSGILTGGVIGGIGQTGRWKLDARFHKRDLVQRIQRIARYRARINLYCMDAERFIRRLPATLSDAALVYLDPPYYHKGQDLYESHYSAGDHRRIASLVRKQLCRPWIVSYDDVPEITCLYDGLPSLHYSIAYSAQRRYAGAEVLFHHPDLRVPAASTPMSVRPDSTE